MWHSLPRIDSTGFSTSDVWPEINPHAVKMVVPTLDSGVEDATSLWQTLHTLDTLPDAREEASVGASPEPTIINLVDYRLPSQVHDMISTGDPELPFWARLNH